MKKLFFFVAITTFAAGTMVSCGKSTKGKMDAEWTIDSATDKSTSTDVNGITSTTTIDLGSGKRTRTVVSGGQTTKKVATLNDAQWSIKKDGTWSKSVSYTEVDTTEILGTTYFTTRNITTIENGNWDFLTGVGEFKKNERVSFSVTNSKTTTTTTASQSGSSTTTTNTTTDTDTFKDGENTEIYVIGESKKKSLSLTFSGSSSNTQTSTSGSGSTSTSKETLDKSYTLSSN